MKGTHEVTVKNKRVQYKFTLRRNLTFLRDDSATGKTTLIDLIAQYGRDGENSGVFLQCDKPCTVLTSDLWQIRLFTTKNSVVFIDADNAYGYQSLLENRIDSAARENESVFSRKSLNIIKSGSFQFQITRKMR